MEIQEIKIPPKEPSIQEYVFLILIVLFIIQIWMLYTINNIYFSMQKQGMIVSITPQDISKLLPIESSIRIIKNEIISKYMQIGNFSEEKKEELTMPEYLHAIDVYSRYDPTIKNYVENSKYVICTPILKSISDSLYNESSFTLTIANIMYYVTANLEYPVDYMNDFSCSHYFNAQEILSLKKGCCLSYSILFCALARCNQIPCRVVFGDLIDVCKNGVCNVISGNATSIAETHAWVEVAYVFNETIGWIPIETTAGKFISQETISYYEKRRVFE